MSVFFSVTNLNTGDTTVIPNFTENDGVIPKNPVVSNNNNYLGVVSLVSDNFEGWNRSAAFIKDLANDTTVTINGHRLNEFQVFPHAEVRFDSSSRFGCYTEQTSALMCFELSSGNSINVSIPDEFRNYIWVSSVFSPTQPKLYLAGYDRRESERLLGKSAILVIETAGWTTLEIIRVPFLMTMKNGFGIGDHSSLGINSEGTELHIPNLNSTNVIYNLITNQLTTTGYTLDEKMEWGALSKSVAMIQSRDGGEAAIKNYPTFTTIQLGDPEQYVRDISLESGGVSVNAWPWTGAPVGFINALDGRGLYTDSNFYDPITALQVLRKPWSIDLEFVDEASKPTSPLNYYQRVCTALGLDHSVVIPEVATDDTAVLRSSNFTPFNSTHPDAPLYFTVSADTGFGFYLRDQTEVPSYVAPLKGPVDEYLPRASFKTLNPPYLVLNAKPKVWDMQIVEYREQKTSTATVAYMRAREVYGNYPEEIEVAVYFTAAGRLDFVTGVDYFDRQRVRFLILDDTKPYKDTLDLFGGFASRANNIYVSWFSNSTTPFDLQA